MKGPGDRGTRNAVFAKKRLLTNARNAVHDCVESVHRVRRGHRLDIMVLYGVFTAGKLVVVLKTKGGRIDKTKVLRYLKGDFRF